MIKKQSIDLRKGQIHLEFSDEKKKIGDTHFDFQLMDYQSAKNLWMAAIQMQVRGWDAVEIIYNLRRMETPSYQESIP